MLTLFRTQARANAWANERLGAEAAGLTREQLAEPLDVNFGSILGILNHLILADRLWLHRFTGQGPAPQSVSGIPYPEPGALTAARRAEDARIMAFAEGLTEDFLERPLDFRTTEGTACREPAAVLVAHFFNHQTHHRAQVHALLGRFGVKPGDLDLLLFQRETRAYG